MVGLSLVEEEVGLVTLLLPNEIVFCEPLAAGPPELRVRRAGGILYLLMEGTFFVGFLVWQC